MRFTKTLRQDIFRVLRFSSANHHTKQTAVPKEAV